MNILCEKGKFVTNVYRKKTVIGVYTNFNSFILEFSKTGLIKLLSSQCSSLCLDFVEFHCEINILKSILYKNNYPHDFVDKSIREFLNRALTPEIVVSTAPKKDLMVVLGLIV